MTRVRKNVLPAAMSIVLSIIPINLAAQGSPVIERHTGVAPDLNEEGHVVQGETIYTEFDHASQKAAVLLKDVEIGPKAAFLAGDTLLGYSGKGENHYCRFDETRKKMGMKNPLWICLVPGRGEDFVAWYLIPDGASTGRRRNLKNPIPFEWTEVPLPTDLAAELEGRRLFRNEIVYQGAAGGVLRLLYREFTNDLARPAFSQELTYDLPHHDQVLTVAVKGARLEIKEANNDGIRYRVIQGFK